MTKKNKEINNQVIFDIVKAKFTVIRPESIREKVAAWAFENVEDIESVIACLERIDCAACYSPAPIYNHDMAREIGWHWQEIDEAIDGFRDETGEAPFLRKNHGFLNYLWFTYEWIAHQLASEIRNEIETTQEGA
jgi:hypothetical protein